MADQTNQTLQLLRHLLIDNAAFSALLASGAVFTAHPKTGELASIPMPSVILEITSGIPGAAGVPLQQMSLDLYLYSRTSQAEAFTIYEEARALLNMARLHSDVASGGNRTNKTDGYARESERPSGGWNEQVSAWYAKGRFTVYTVTGST